MKSVRASIFKTLLFALTLPVFGLVGLFILFELGPARGSFSLAMSLMSPKGWASLPVLVVFYILIFRVIFRYTSLIRKNGKVIFSRNEDIFIDYGGYSVDLDKIDTEKSRVYGLFGFAFHLLLKDRTTKIYSTLNMINSDKAHLNNFFD